MSNHLDLISPDENPNWIRVRQATKQGYIRLHRGGAPTSHTHTRNCVEAEFRKMDRSALR